MRYQRLGDADLTVSVVALGCGNFGGVGSIPALIGKGDVRADAFALMDHAREQGVTLFDTANSYGGGTSEEWIGAWLASRRSRDEIVLTTKVRNRMGPGPDDEGLSASHIRTQVEASLRRLGTDHIDLYLAHEPYPPVPIEETLGAFDELVRAGKIRHAGLSNFTAMETDAAATAAARTGVRLPVNLQCGYSLLDRSAAPDTFDVCARHGIGFTAYSPLGGGWLSGKYRPDEPFPEDSRMGLRPSWFAGLTPEQTYAAVARLAGAAGARDVALPTLALSWVIHDPGVTAIVVGARTTAQVDQALRALDLPLTADERAELASIATAREAGDD